MRRLVSVAQLVPGSRHGGDLVRIFVTKTIEKLSLVGRILAVYLKIAVHCTVTVQCEELTEIYLQTLKKYSETKLLLCSL